MPANEDAIAMLLEDHQKVKKLFADYQGVGPRANAKRKTLYERIRRDLELHSDLEESTFYPAARAVARDLITEATKEHKAVDKLLTDIGKIEPSNDRFTEMMKELIQNVEHHVSEEEGQLFPKVKSDLGPEKLTELGKKMMDRKRGAKRTARAA